MLDYIFLILLFPLLGVLVNGIFGKKLSKNTVSIVGCGSVFLSFIISLFSFLELISISPEHRNFEIVLFNWIQSDTLSVNFSLLLDPLSCVMILVVTGVGFLIHIYSTGYMSGDPNYSRYFTYLNLFVFSMLMLVLGDNFLVMFVGWELVGLCSYLLIGFWFEKKSAADAGKKAFIVNRIGDFGFILGIMMIFLTFGTLDFKEVFSSAKSNFSTGDMTLTIITLLLFVGACGKSAQIPLHIWLPDAMEGPTPVSALIHAATMVTAGVYMVTRCNVLYELAPISSITVASVGALTAIFSASIGLVQFDIKRILAYSTVSQLGYMFLATGIGAYSSGIFHLTTHAFFKALLFLGAGSVMHALSGETDIRKMGDLRHHLPITYKTILIASLAIAGIFPFAGFFSKDEILHHTISSGFLHLWIIGIITALMTAFYTFRLIFLVFYTQSRVEKEVAKHIHESPKNMTIPLIILAVLSATGGLLGIPEAFLKHANLMENFLQPVIYFTGEKQNLHSKSFEIFLMLFSLGVAVFGIMIAYYFFIKSPDVPDKIKNRFSSIYKLLLNKYYIDEVYIFIFVKPGKAISEYILWKMIDIGIVDGCVNLVGWVTQGFGKIFSILHTGFARNYALIFLLGVVFLIWIALK